MKFKFQVLPIPKGRPKFTARGGFVKTYTPEKTRVFETSIKVMARAQMVGSPLLGPLIAGIVFQFKKPKTSKLLIPSPDIDNLQKAVLDACNEIVFVDDKQIWFVQAIKRWGETDCILMELEARGPDKDGV